MKTIVAMILTLSVLVGGLMAFTLPGCCKYPSAVMQVHDSLSSVQGFYDALVAKFLDDKTNVVVHGAVISADLALHLAGALQKQWCPDPTLVLQAENLAVEAKVKAIAAGIK